MRRLTDDTIKRYKQLEADGKLTSRQRKMWDSHNKMVYLFGNRKPMSQDELDKLSPDTIKRGGIEIIITHMRS